MTDEELIARLREDVFYGDERLHNLSRHNPLHMEAADRIEALIAERDARPAWQEWKEILAAGYEQKSRAEAAEAKLAKAVGCLTHYATCPVEEIRLEARATLAEIKSHSDEFATQKGESHE